jgi:hypothetical protein
LREEAERELEEQRCAPDGSAPNPSADAQSAPTQQLPAVPAQEQTPLVDLSGGRLSDPGETLRP